MLRARQHQPVAAGGRPRGRRADAAARPRDQQDRIVSPCRRFCHAAELAIIRGPWILSANGRSGSSSPSASPCCSPCALVYTSFSASTEAKEPSQLLNAAPGASYEHDRPGGQGLGAARRRAACASASPTATAQGESIPVTYSGVVPDPFRGGREIVLTGEVEHGHLRRRARHAGDQVPVEVHDGGCQLASAAPPSALAFLTALFAVVAALAGRDGERRWVDLSRRAVYALCGAAHLLRRPHRDRLRQRRLLLQHRPAALLDRDAHLLQDGGDVVEPGGLAAALGLGPLDRLLAGALRDPRQAARAGPLGDRGDGRRRRASSPA